MMVAVGAPNPGTGYEEAPGPSSVTAAATGDTAAVRRFLESAGVILNDEHPMTLLEMKSYVRGRLMR